MGVRKSRRGFVHRFARVIHKTKRLCGPTGCATPAELAERKPVADSLTDVTELAAELGGPRPPALLDVRWRLTGPPGIESYRTGHLPGARFVDLDRDLAGPPGAGGRHPLPAAGDFQDAMRRAGVRDGWPVVVYDEADSTAAARAWWLLRYFGHDRVRVLDGGYQAWLAAGQPVHAGYVHRPARAAAVARRGRRGGAGPGRGAARRPGGRAVPG